MILAKRGIDRIQQLCNAMTRCSMPTMRGEIAAALQKCCVYSLDFAQLTALDQPNELVPFSMRQAHGVCVLAES